MTRAELAVCALLAAGCTVPDLKIEEQASVSEPLDASAAESDAGVELDTRERDGGMEVRTGAPAAGEGGRAGTAAVGGAGTSARGGAGAAAPPPSAGTAAVAGRAGASGPSPAGMGGAAGAAGAAGTSAPMEPARACLLWTSINVRNGPPAGAIEAGFETVAGVRTRQYICRLRPAGSTYAIPGKYVDRVGCYVVERRDGQVTDSSSLEGLIDVLVPAPGCTFSWRAGSGAELPQGAIDLGDPPGGGNYACRGEYSTLAASGTQIGRIIPSTDTPALNQCWFESFSNAIQPSDPSKFEVLVLDPA